MALRGCYFCIKYLVFTFNFIFWLLGCVLLGLGLWTKFSPETLRSIGSKSSSPVLDQLFEEMAASNQVIVGLVIALGAIIMIIGFFGCCGAIKESKTMLGLYFIFLLLIFTILLGLGIYLAVHKDQVKHHLAEVVDAQIAKKENGDEEAAKFMDYLQKQFSCCGAMYGVSDYSNQYHSDCVEANKQTPCVKSVYISMKSYSTPIIAVAASVSIVMILGMIFSILLCCAIREQI